MWVLEHNGIRVTHYVIYVPPGVPYCCGQLNAHLTCTPPDDKDMTVWIQDPDCQGEEADLLSCPGSTLGDMAWGTIDHTSDVQAICYNEADAGELNLK